MRARQGSIRHARAKRAHDLYETPACAVTTLLRVEDIPSVVWEPCAGRGAIARVLAASGRTVIASDIKRYRGADPEIEAPLDFLQICKRAAPTIVTNPPFAIADSIIRRGLALDCTVIVLLRLMALEGAGRAEIIDRHLRRLWIGVERLPMMHRDGWTGPKLDTGAMPFAWFVFGPSERAMDEPITLSRMSWREA